LHLFPKSIFRSKRADVAQVILSLARDDRSIIDEYLITKQIRLLEAKGNRLDFEELPYEELEEFLEKDLNMKLSDLESITRDRAIIVYYTQIQEKLLATTQGNVGRL